MSNTVSIAPPPVDFGADYAIGLKTLLNTLMAEDQIISEPSRAQAAVASTLATPTGTSAQEQELLPDLIEYENAETASRPEQDRIEHETAEAARKAEQDRIEREKAEATRKAEQERS